MVNLEKNENIEKCNKKKDYTQPQLKEIGKLDQMTKGSATGFGADSSFPFFIDS